ncbi:PREDICTED: EF-hand calcium-binding domain-containing protein 2-like [Amphimedon queenslandica]|nr:PREDICTED: EF-hand calcium-binding domain-containing protein 2-like [Amphimedon queenslandica]|eukprot:XP_003385793.1 PREDICTED: EF-hand calcium-binding domain-containing protein 2-like [Amphimedon queenslandica]
MADLEQAPSVPEVQKKEADPVILEINQRIEEAFDIFDHEQNKTVDVREVGTVIRSLGCYPTQSELNDMIQEIEEEEPTGFILYDKFQPMMARVLIEGRYKPVSEEQLLKAFKVLDKDKKSYLTPEQLKEYMTTEGEAFQQEEIEEMLQASVDPEKKTINYHEFVTLILGEENQPG